MAPFLHPFLNVHIFAKIFSSETQVETKLYYLCAVNFEYRYKIKGQHMNMSTLCTIRYMNRPYFSKAVYKIGVGFKILGRTPVPKLPPSYPPPPPPPPRSAPARVLYFAINLISYASTEPVPIVRVSLRADHCSLQDCLLRDS